MPKPHELHQYQFLTPSLLGRLLSGQLVVLFDIHCLPRVANPYILDRAGCQVSILTEHVLRKTALLLLVLVLR